MHVTNSLVKICWAKHLWFQHYEAFCGALASSVYYLTIATCSWEKVCGILKNHKSLAQ